MFPDDRIHYPVGITLYHLQHSLLSLCELILDVDDLHDLGLCDE